MTEHVPLLIQKRNGRALTEPVHAEPLGGGKYRLLHSPGFVQGIAAGDEFELNENEGTFHVTKRSGNLAIQIYGKQSIQALVGELTRIAAQLSGVVDGSIEKGIVLTVPVSVGFPKIQEEMETFCARHANVEWFYGNVYETTDGITPIGWWTK